MKKKSAKNNSGYICQQVGHKIRQQRQALRYTTAELGLLVGVSQQQISRYELGISRMTVSGLFDISVALQVPVNWLLRDVSPFNQRVK